MTDSVRTDKDRYLFRMRDVILSTAGLMALSPLMLIVACWVRLDSPGAVLYRQQRVGMNGSIFHILKFRSMKIDSDGPLISSSVDDRITRAGRILRNSKIDELPQLINVLRGEMSLVGPRPEVVFYVNQWSEEDKSSVLSVRPGLSDPVTVMLRDEGVLLARSPDPEATYQDVIMPAKLKLYRDYVRDRSLSRDFIIIWQTVLAIVRPSRAGSGLFNDLL